MDNAFPTRTVEPAELAAMIGNNPASWRGESNLPDTVTMRRMLFRADYAAENPLRWKLFKARITQPRKTQRELAEDLKISLSSLKRMLCKIRLPKECEMYDEFGDLITAPPYETKPEDPFFSER